MLLIPVQATGDESVLHIFGGNLKVWFWQTHKSIFSPPAYKGMWHRNIRREQEDRRTVGIKKNKQSTEKMWLTAAKRSLTTATSIINICNEITEAGSSQHTQCASNTNQLFFCRVIRFGLFALCGSDFAMKWSLDKVQVKAGSEELGHLFHLGPKKLKKKKNQKVSLLQGKIGSQAEWNRYDIIGR